MSIFQLQATSMSFVACIVIASSSSHPNTSSSSSPSHSRTVIGTVDGLDESGGSTVTHTMP